MISSQLIEQVKFEEGFRSRIYKCTSGHNTIGFGHNLDAKPYYKGIRIKAPLNKTLAYEILLDDLIQATNITTRRWPAFYKLSGARKDAIVQMAFQLGIDGLLGFKNMRKAIEQEDWSSAHSHALDSKWAKIDTPNRAKRVAGQLLTGEHYGIPNQ